ncbi:helix-turn-helix transcriptional regulator [Methylomonas sp. LL1]|uniref:helix-turn-helix domain-containing protein n=1 Tax=Methylomonas sp. LL1 TaxID=2785785 RepID=UPI0018C354CE|nr:helix-turn-helix transcriptional regulator [Methylomonas sp. LL1]QPK62534.1 helix-turn-helix transcriptional regulator [Methylomonas sp. LL1]
MHNNPEPDDCVLFGRRLTKIRKERGFSQEQLSRNCGIAQSYLSNVEQGKRNISLRNICLLARVLAIAPSELLMFDTE